MKLARMSDTSNHRDFYPLIQIKSFSLKILVHPITIIRKRRNVETVELVVWLYHKVGRMLVQIFKRHAD